MKLFIDSADRKLIARWAATGILDGVTTNPSLLAKETADPTVAIQEIAQMLPDGKISVEVTHEDPDAVEQQARQIVQLAPNIVVKIPCALPYYPVIKRLVQQGVTINVTLVFTLIQATIMGRFGVAYISPFVGRWNDIDVSGTEVVYAMCQMLDRYGLSTQLLAASIRTVRDLHEVIEAGAHVATVPAAVLDKATRHVLTRDGLKAFLDDWKRAQIDHFP